ncbi:MAG: hypothetical protein EXR27_05720 [Betaproteobacteria bacterium]|nr:hypothetical protein [Betaproteobacteria bacterium]
MPSNLTGDIPSSSFGSIPMDEGISMRAQSLLDDLQKLFNIEYGDKTMFAIEMPDFAYQVSESMVVEAVQSKSGQRGNERTIGICQLVQNPIPTYEGEYLPINSLGPVGAARIYFENDPSFTSVLARGDLRILNGPTYGKLEPSKDAPGGFWYVPNQGYFGPDRATFEIQSGSVRVRVEYFFRVLDSVGSNRPDEEHKRLCPNGSRWRISQSFGLENSGGSASLAKNVSDLTLVIADLGGKVVG